MERSISITLSPAVLGRLWLRRANWWLFAIGPLGVAAVVTWHHLVGGVGQMHTYLEPVAPYLVAVATGLYAIRAAVTRNPLYVILTFLAASLTCREVHFVGMDKAIFALLAVAGVWAYLWRDRLAVPIRDWRHTSWLVATLATYFLSQLIAKRVFKASRLPIIPGEGTIHTSLEEVAETVAHLMLLVTVAVGSWRRYRRDGART